MESFIQFNEEDPYLLEIGLRRLLKSKGINLRTWGIRTRKSVRDLIKEILSKESQLYLNENGELIRQMRVAAITVKYSDKTGRYRLRESKQIFSNGSSRTRNWEESVSEKGIQGETAEETFRRALRQELSQITRKLGEDWVNSLEFTDIVRDVERYGYSKSYPGLMSRRLVNSATVQLSKEHFIPEGYSEVQDEITTFFTWELEDEATEEFPIES